MSKLRRENGLLPTLTAPVLRIFGYAGAALIGGFIGYEARNEPLLLSAIGTAAVTTSGVLLWARRISSRRRRAARDLTGGPAI